MRSLKTILATAAVASCLGVAGAAVTSTPAMAYVACNRAGECWHTDRRFAAPGIGLMFHDDAWRGRQHWGAGRWRWRDDHPGRGYYRNGVWITF
ncbi:MAG: hypothetical protein WDN45_16470 [Caulobacteraceae bacterium]